MEVRGRGGGVGGEAARLASLCETKNHGESEFGIKIRRGRPFFPLYLSPVLIRLNAYHGRYIQIYLANICPQVVS